MNHSLSALLAAGCLTISPSFADTIYVDAGLTTGANDGTSWADAFQGEGGLDEALIARTPADVIWVAEGRYRPTRDQELGRFTYAIDGRIRMYGGFAGGESTLGERPPLGAAQTILDGDLLGDDGSPGGSKADNTGHLLALWNVDGLFNRITIEGGYAWNGQQIGGAVQVGGAQGVLVSFTSCTFRQNSAQVEGGAIAARTVFGGNVNLFNCRFLDNRVGTWGGALWMGGTGQLRIDSCEFSGNSAGGGGALWLDGSSLDVTVQNSVFAMNEARAPWGAGAIYANSDDSSALQVDGCTIYGNRALASGWGGLIIVRFPLTVTHSILWGNVGNGGGSGADSQVWVSSGSASPQVSYSIIQGWTGGGTGNLSVDPMLTDPMGGDFEPMAGSPAVDAGGPLDPAAPGIGDFLLNRRRVDDPQTVDTGVGPAPMIDIGAVERGVGAIGKAVCVVNRNSTGARGKVDAFGSDIATDNNFTLVASDLPPQQFGIFIVSRDTGFVPSTSGASLCLAGAISRITGPGQVLSSGAAGQFSLALDLTAMPTHSGFTTVMAGQSWSFQAWHRDVAGSFGYGFADATTVDFR